MISLDYDIYWVLYNYDIYSDIMCVRQTEVLPPHWTVDMKSAYSKSVLVSLLQIYGLLQMAALDDLFNLKS